MVQPLAFQISVLPSPSPLQADGQVDAGLEALGVDVVGDRLHAVGEADRVGRLTTVLVEARLQVLSIHKPA